MKQFIKKIKKEFTIHIVIFRYYSLNDWICTVGGFLVCLMLPLLIGLIWLDQTMVLKLIITNILAIVFIWLMDKATK
tara:strand:+ start:146 stop:376 length:231 start_codon:yes stop_codon:yes gene_type:complete